MNEPEVESQDALQLKRILRRRLKFVHVQSAVRGLLSDCTPPEVEYRRSTLPRVSRLRPGLAVLA
jgi:hypothetical protein